MELNQIFCEDCIDTMRNMPKSYVDLVVTSPPYDNLRDYNGFTFDYQKTVDGLFRVLKPGGVVVWIVGDATIKGSKTGTSFRQALCFMDAGFRLHDTMIWHKGSFTAVGALKTRYAPVYEFMFIFSKGRPKTFNPIKDRKNKYANHRQKKCFRERNGDMTRNYNTGRFVAEYGQRFNVWEIPPNRRNQTGHPAVFPESLVRDHILTWSNAGDVVYDPFMGSGTTALAAIKQGRSFMGSEISSEYCEIATARLKKEKFGE